MDLKNIDDERLKTIIYGLKRSVADLEAEGNKTEFLNRFKKELKEAEAEQRERWDTPRGVL